MPHLDDFLRPSYTRANCCGIPFILQERYPVRSGTLPSSLSNHLCATGSASAHSCPAGGAVGQVCNLSETRIYSEKTGYKPVLRQTTKVLQIRRLLVEIPPLVDT